MYKFIKQPEIFKFLHLNFLNFQRFYKLELYHLKI